MTSERLGQPKILHLPIINQEGGNEQDDGVINNNDSVGNEFIGVTVHSEDDKYKSISKKLSGNGSNIDNNNNKNLFDNVTHINIHKEINGQIGIRQGILSSKRDNMANKFQQDGVVEFDNSDGVVEFDNRDSKELGSDDG